MKVKFIDKEGSAHLKLNSIYEAEDASKECFAIFAGGEKLGFFSKERFKILFPEEEIMAEIKETEARLSVLREELANLQKPKVGRKYLHESGDKYILVEVNGEFVLACFDGSFSYLGGTYGNPTKNIKEVFRGLEDLFSLIK